MRSMILRISWVLAVVVSTAAAQNSDLGLLLGVSHLAEGTIASGTVSGSVSASGQVNYAVQLRDSPAGRLYLELPLIITGSSTGTIAGGVVSGTDEALFFFTPGVRWLFTPAARVSLYAAGGIGMVAVARDAGVVGKGVIRGTSDVGATGAASLGIGLDFRLTRLVSLRADFRELPTFVHVHGSHNHEVFMLGVGLHF